MKSKGPTLLPSLVLALSGAVLGLYGLSGAMASWNSATLEAPIGPMVIMFVGGSLFAVGGLMLIVVMVRPFFEKREADHIADEIAAEIRDGRPRH